MQQASSNDTKVSSTALDRAATLIDSALRGISDLAVIADSDSEVAPAGLLWSLAHVLEGAKAEVRTVQDALAA